MNKELIEVFKPVFDEDPALGKLLTNSDDVIGFDELCAQGYITDSIGQCLDNVDSTRSCAICISVDEDSPSDKCICMDIVCLHKYLFNGEKKLRPYEIASHINRVINRKAKFGEGILEKGFFCVESFNGEKGILWGIYRPKDTQPHDDGRLDIFEYYEKYLFNVVEDVFSSDDIKKQLTIRGVSADGVPFRELLETGYIRMSVDLGRDEEEDNIFVIISLGDMNGITLKADVFGSSGKAGTGVQSVKEKAKMLSDMIDQKMLSMSGIKRSSYNESKLHGSLYRFSRSYLIPRTEEEAEKAEREKSIKVGFFADMDVLRRISETELTDDHTEVGISLDLIQTPMHFVFSNKDGLEYRFNIRDEMAAYETPDFAVKMHGSDSEPEIEINKNFTEDSVDYLKQFMNYMLSLAKFVQVHGIMEQFSFMDMTREGVLLYLDGDDIKYRLLREKERPDLMCSTVFGGNVMKRPYQDEIAASWMEQASEAGDTDAEISAKQYRAAAEAKKKAEAGDPQGQGDYAGALMAVGGSLSQTGSAADYKESIRWARKAEGKDDGEASFVLGLAYEHGRGVKPDMHKAFKYYKRGADKGHAICMNNMGLMCQNGEGTQKDEKMAFELFLQAAEKEYGPAMQNVGRCCQFGLRTDCDMAKAIEWYEKSLEILPDPELAQKVEIFKELEAQEAPEEK